MQGGYIQAADRKPFIYIEILILYEDIMVICIYIIYLYKGTISLEYRGRTL